MGYMNKLILSDPGTVVEITALVTYHGRKARYTAVMDSLEMTHETLGIEGLNIYDILDKGCHPAMPARVTMFAKREVDSQVRIGRIEYLDKEET